MRKKKISFVAILVGIIAVGAFFLVAQARLVNVEYGWLIFGPKGEVRALISATGTSPRDTIAIQPFVRETPIGRKLRFRNTGEPVEITLADLDGVTSYVIRKAASPVGHGAMNGKPVELFVNVEIRGPINYRQYGDLVALAPEAETASVSHFHGPLTIGPETSWGSSRPTWLCRAEGRKTTCGRTLARWMPSVVAGWL